MHRAFFKSVVIPVVPLENQSCDPRLAMTVDSGLYQWST